ncbi:hypothetical protein [Streptomyces sp. NPDC057002]|uniref:hypothetical protein n=1 Tax=Streptomyces sp. NPDC057002 TaxID=3345992 RepID=UPI0036347857
MPPTAAHIPVQANMATACGLSAEFIEPAMTVYSTAAVPTVAIIAVRRRAVRATV